MMMVAVIAQKKTASEDRKDIWWVLLNASSYWSMGLIVVIHLEDLKSREI